MASPVYSTVFIAESALVLSTATVGAGEVFIVRDIDIVSFSALAATFLAYDAATVTFFSYTFPAGSASSQWAGWRGRQVLLEGDKLTITATQPISARVSGYVLSA